MRLSTRLGMSRQLVVLSILVFSIPFFAFHYLESEIARLDVARVKLEEALRGHRQRSSGISPEDALLSLNDDELVVIYNRVPKTGSTSFAGIAYDLCYRNKFTVIHINVTKNNHVMSLADQVRFVNNVSFWDAKKPVLYHGHIAFLDFQSRMGLRTNPIYINVIRDPLDRLVSYYYFLRHGDDFRPHLKRRRSGNKQTFDDCVAHSGSDCDPENLWMQIPFFCGHTAECWIPGSKWALQMAKLNVINRYFVVGLTEELGDFVALLETALPRFFAGATELFNSGHKSHLRKTFNKIPPSPETIARIQQSEIWQMEHEFYEFVRDHFHFMKKKAFELRNGVLQEREQLFMYEKIRPR